MRYYAQAAAAVKTNRTWLRENRIVTALLAIFLGVFVGAFGFYCFRSDI